MDATDFIPLAPVFFFFFLLLVDSCTLAFTVWVGHKQVGKKPRSANIFNTSGITIIYKQLNKIGILNSAVISPDSRANSRLTAWKITNPGLQYEVQGQRHWSFEGHFREHSQCQYRPIRRLDQTLETFTFFMPITNVTVYSRVHNL